MKKNFQYLLLCLALTLGTVCLASCGGSKSGNAEENAGEDLAVEAVDLGLSVKWASCNLGATKPEERGNYYAWGSVEPYAADDNVVWSLYFEKLGGAGADSAACGTENDPLRDYVCPNQKSLAGTEFDAAKAQLGGNWRVPTCDEVRELFENTTHTWTTENGVNGYKLTSTKNGNSIFLPATGYHEGTEPDSECNRGYYWCATPHTEYAYFASFLFIDSSGFVCSSAYRYGGFALRPVTE